MATTPATATTETYCISETLTGYTIESVNITDTPQVEEVRDQKNALINEIKYDTLVELRLVVRGATKPTAGSDITYNNVKYRISSVEDAGSYNGLRRYTVTAKKADNFPPQGS